MKKRNLCLMLVICMFATFLPCASVAASIKYDDLYYEINNDNTVTITDCDSSSTIFIIPGTINGLTVTKIDHHAFSECKKITNIILPNTITYIGEYAFHGCSKLSNIIITGRITEIAEGTFSECTALTHINIPTTVTNIGDAAFYHCNGLTSISIPEDVTDIGDSSFLSCSNLKSISISDSVINIDDYAFANCKKLTSITIPKNTSHIGNCAFSNCGNLEINVNSNNKNYSSADGVLFNKNKTELLSYAKDNIQNQYTIPDSIISIGSGAFRNCGNLTSITIPSNIDNIGSNAFIGCKQLSNIYFDGSQSQWDNITIDSNNDPLLNATIHFLSEPCFTILQIANKAEITNTSEDEKLVTVIIAEYDNNILKDIFRDDTKFTKNEKKTYDLSSSGQYKVFVWDSLQGMRPLNK